MNKFAIICVLIGILSLGSFELYPFPNQGYPYQRLLGLSSDSKNLPNTQFVDYSSLSNPDPNTVQIQQSRVENPYLEMGRPYPGMLAPYPSIAFPYQVFGYPYPWTVGYPQQTVANREYGNLEQDGQYTQSPNEANWPKTFDNTRTEILDVSPEYQRQIYGWTAEVAPNIQGLYSPEPRYTVNTDSHTTNVTNIPSNLKKPIISEKKFVTSIRRTFIYDSSKPENMTPVNIHLVNGEIVTTAPTPTTTISEEVEGNNSSSTIKPTGRRFMDVPKKCPKGSMLAHNGQCIEPFAFRNPSSNATHEQETENGETTMSATNQNNDMQ